MSFWDWFNRPFAEVAAGLVMVGLLFLVYLVFVYISRKK